MSAVEPVGGDDAIPPTRRVNPDRNAVFVGPSSAVLLSAFSCVMVFQRLTNECPELKYLMAVSDQSAGKL